MGKELYTCIMEILMCSMDKSKKESKYPHYPGDDGYSDGLVTSLSKGIGELCFNFRKGFFSRGYDPIRVPGVGTASKG